VSEPRMTRLTKTLDAKALELMQQPATGNEKSSAQIIDEMRAEITALREQVCTYERITDKLAETNVALTLENTTLREQVQTLREFAHIAHQLSMYAAASRRQNTPEYLEGMMEECKAVQDAYMKIVTPEANP